MSAAGFLEELLDGADVEWEPLGEVTQPTANIKWSQADGVYQYIDLTSVDIKTKRVTEASEITAETAPSRAQKLVKENDVIFATTRPAQQRYCLIDSELAGNVASTGYCVLRAKKDQVLPKWILHWLGTTEFKNYVEENQSGAAYPAISDGKVKAFKIPIPCPDDPEKSLAIQGEIVRILDTFTELTAELTAGLAAELAQRKKQYSHYRDQLLTFNEDEVEWKTLGDIATLRRGRVMSKGYLRDNAGVYPVYSSQTANNGMIGQIDTFDFDGEYVSWTTDGANAGTVFYRNEKFSITNVCGVIKENGTCPLDLKFLSFWLSTEAKKHVYSGMGNPKLMSHQVEKIPIPIPFPDDPKISLEAQKRVAAILDKLDALTTSLTEILPREIELREKQYAYYRDQLLSFPKPDAEAF
ncbi:Restriction modification system DNA specificity domain [Rhodopseudomonas palustris HaA2]|uniref:Restriction modification system DNA specificity domain n=1 Tax=Rhodopseudomonas palustris (strain HaA2) TaxID=316058 RepID=Q2IVK4_RHOP2|nr:restriction endonuclease subunit S [Rhodopseudomonas palustris]ABD07756.1 Restriction modification system DNA specificity domain [Rhodopseudomonas palustris HaA2]